MSRRVNRPLVLLGLAWCAAIAMTIGHARAQDPRTVVVSRAFDVVRDETAKFAPVRESLAADNTRRTEGHDALRSALADKTAERGARLARASAAIDTIVDSIDKMTARRGELVSLYARQLDALERARELTETSDGGGRGGPGDAYRRGVEARLDTIAALLEGNLVPESMRGVLESLYGKLVELGTEEGSGLLKRLDEMFARALQMLERVRLDVWQRHADDMLRLGALDGERTALLMHKQILATAEGLLAIEDILAGLVDVGPLVGPGGLSPEVQRDLDAVVAEISRTTQDAGPPPDPQEVRADIRRRFEKNRRSAERADAGK